MVKRLATVAALLVFGIVAVHSRPDGISALSNDRVLGNSDLVGENDSSDSRDVAAVFERGRVKRDESSDILRKMIDKNAKITELGRAAAQADAATRRRIEENRQRVERFRSYVENLQQQGLARGAAIRRAIDENPDLANQLVVHGNRPN